MKLPIFVFLLPLAFSLPNSFADTGNAIRLVDAIHLLEKSGYNTIQKIKYDKNNYDVTVINRQGNKLNLKLNLVNGEVQNLPQATILDMAGAIGVLEKAGYKNIDSIESKKHFYKANIVDFQGKKRTFKVSFDKGAIMTDMQ